MIANIRRYVRAFVMALQFTLRGQKPPLLQVREQHPKLAAWWSQTETLLKAIEQTAEANQIALENIQIHVNRRDQSAATALATIRFHVEREYPFLFVNDPQYGQMTLQATNLNDRYLVTKLLDQSDEVLKPSIEALNEHLALIPSEEAAKV